MVDRVLRGVPATFREWNERVFPTWTWDQPHLVLLQETLDKVALGELGHVIIEMPPRHGKSETTTVRFPVYRLEDDPSKRVIIGAYNDTFAAKFGRKARRAALVAGVTLSTDRNAADDWETTEGGGVRSVGVGAGITGHGGDLIIVDDPVKNREEAESETYREKVWEWFTDDLYTRREPGAAVIVIMTRWHEDDLVGRILASDHAPKWTVIRLPALAEPGDALGRSVGEALWPDRYPVDELASIKTLQGSYAFNALYQQRPSAPEGGLFKRTWWKYYERPPAKFDMIVQSWDMSFKDTKGSDFVVGQVWGVLGANAFLLHEDRAQRDFPSTVQAVRALTASHPGAVAKYVEDKANGPAVIATLRREISGMVAVDPEGGKVARASAVSPLVEAGNVFLPIRAAWVSDYVDELASFPTGRYDDRVDATSQALLRLQPHMRRAMVSIKRKSDIDRAAPLVKPKAAQNGHGYHAPRRDGLVRA